MWKILICDDDSAFLHRFRCTIKQVADRSVKQIELFQDREKFEFYLEDNPDEANIVFIDVHMGGDCGIKLAEHTLSKQPDSQIIFISEDDKYFTDIYTVEHVYFLKKPVDIKHLEKAITRASEKINELELNSLIVSNKEGIHRVPFNEILFFENERRKIHVHTKNEKISYYGKFEELMLQLDERFKRCHNSYIVNTTKVRELKDKKFYFEADKSIPVSKTYYGEMRKHLLNYLGQEFFKRGGVDGL